MAETRMTERKNIPKDQACVGARAHLPGAALNFENR